MTINQSSKNKNVSNWTGFSVLIDSHAVPIKNSNFHNFLHKDIHNPYEILN